MLKLIPTLTFATVLLALTNPSEARYNAIKQKARKSKTQTVIITQPAFSDTQTILIINSSSRDTLEIVIPQSEYEDTLSYVISTSEVSQPTQYQYDDDYDDYSDSQYEKSKSRGKSRQESQTSKPSTSGSKTASGDWREHCLDMINAYRASENVAPLVLADNSKQTCIDKQAANDFRDNVAHGHFGACGESAQNTGSNYNRTATRDEMSDDHLLSMWNEKKLIESGERDPNNESDFHAIGHYLNMRNPAYKSVACGYVKSTDGSRHWFNYNFYR